jgi:dsDNA-binding SOS-regulon protein
MVSKNALPTFVRAMHKTFSDLIRDLVEVYVDDIIVKVKSSASLLDNLALVFDRLRLTHTKLNPDKCVFGVTASKLLGFLVLCRGIEANPEKIRAIKAMWPHACIKDVQKLTGCLVALSRFISRLAELALPFFKLLQKSRPFIWTNDTEEVFHELKRYLTSSPVMVAPEPSEPLMLYIAATSEAVSMVLVAERPDPHALHELRSSSADGSGSHPRRSRELTRQQGPSPWRPPWAPLTRVSRGP